MVLGFLAVVNGQDFHHRGDVRIEDLDSILNIEDEDKKQYLDQNINASSASDYRF